MPLPLLAAGGLGALLLAVLRWFFLAKLASIIARALGVLGLAYFTNEYIVQPVLDLLHSHMSGLSGDLLEWLDAFGIDAVISIMASAYTIVMVKRVFLGKNE